MRQINYTSKKIMVTAVRVALVYLFFFLGPLFDESHYTVNGLIEEERFSALTLRKRCNEN